MLEAPPLVKGGFARREAIKFGADVGHATRDHHAPDMGGGLADFQDTHDTQRPACRSF